MQNFLNFEGTKLAQKNLEYKKERKKLIAPLVCMHIIAHCYISRYFAFNYLFRPDSFIRPLPREV
ncbi:hypothetical protein PHSC3_000391 [Chlamydiales bacterium STE3]|nr:hypothetical protein PHSC3_000391 [Chlamydiales bacterium STE3]